jgi:5-methylthioadenosine/S-adenosylhomocysteine deaminase
MANGKYSICSDCFITPVKILRGKAYLNVDKGRITGFSSKPASSNIIDLTGKIVAPALVDAHDHLFGNYYPKVGRNDGKYLNWKPWDTDLKASPVYKERSKIPPIDIYYLACYKHILSGCLTVNDHMPHKVNANFLDLMPVRVQKNYALAHESSSFDLRWGDGIVNEHTKAVREGIPFITHIEEGFDPESMKGIDILMLLKALSRNTVLIHGIALSSKDISEIAKAKASLVWCPGSNYFMFRKTGDVRQWLAKGINVALGTDSPASGELNLLYEMKWAKKLYKKIYRKDIPDSTLVEMVTINAAKALWLDKEVGSLDKGKSADITVFSGSQKDPYATVVKADFKDIALVFFKGRPVYGDSVYKSVFAKAGVKNRKLKVAGSPKIIEGDPVALLKGIRTKIDIKDKMIPFLPVE